VQNFIYQYVAQSTHDLKTFGDQNTDRLGCLLLYPKQDGPAGNHSAVQVGQHHAQPGPANVDRSHIPMGRFESQHPWRPPSIGFAIPYPLHQPERLKMRDSAGNRRRTQARMARQIRLRTGVMRPQQLQQTTGIGLSQVRGTSRNQLRS
jgi:hypothetical protein